VSAGFNFGDPLALYITAGVNAYGGCGIYYFENRHEAVIAACRRLKEAKDRRK
jgi:hypothetical protein